MSVISTARVATGRCEGKGIAMDTGTIIGIVALVLLILPFALFFLLIRSIRCSRRMQKDHDQFAARFAPITDLETEISRVRDERAAQEHALAALRNDYAEKRALLDRLKAEVAIYDETLSFAEIGMYSPHFEFEDSESFKAEIIRVRDAQKQMAKDKDAVVAGTEWSVGGSKREGNKMTNRTIRLALRAFNNECDAAISNTNWRNATAMEKRIEKAFEQINKLNETLNVTINIDYLRLKLKELRLTHEHKEKLKEERDHRAEMNRLKREEERLLKEAAEAEKEEAKYLRLLNQAEKQAMSAIGEDLAAQQLQIAELKAQLSEAHARAERAMSMAQQTRAGYIYVISNIGSFGDGVFKIGMTRRLEPMDRVRELGDASVPFLFDLHAMIYSKDAPGVEKELHQKFDAFRVNKANYRKEFFRVSLSDIHSAVVEFDPGAEFVTQPEAQEYFETLAIEKASQQQEARQDSAFPDSI